MCQSPQPSRILEGWRKKSLGWAKSARRGPWPEQRQSSRVQKQTTVDLYQELDLISGESISIFATASTGELAPVMDGSPANLVALVNKCRELFD